MTPPDPTQSRPSQRDRKISSVHPTRSHLGTRLTLRNAPEFFPARYLTLPAPRTSPNKQQYTFHETPQRRSKGRFFGTTSPRFSQPPESKQKRRPRHTATRTHLCATVASTRLPHHRVYHPGSAQSKETAITRQISTTTKKTTTRAHTHQSPFHVVYISKAHIVGSVTKKKNYPPLKNSAATDGDHTTYLERRRMDARAPGRRQGPHDHGRPAPQLLQRPTPHPQNKAHTLVPAPVGI